MGQKLNHPLRIVILTNGGIFPCIVLRHILQDPQFQLVGLIRSKRVFGKNDGFFNGAVKFFTKCGIFYTVYIWFVTTFAEAISKIGFSLGVESIARELKIPVHRTKDVNATQGIEFLKKVSPDLLLCTHFDQKLYSPLCDGEIFSVLNLHPGRLPDYRGLEPVVQTILNGDKSVAVTLHRVSPEFDAGRILNYKELKIHKGDSIFELTCRLMIAGGDLFKMHSHDLLLSESGDSQPISGQYYSWPNSRDIKKALSFGHWLIKFTDLKFFSMAS